MAFPIKLSNSILFAALLVPLLPGEARGERWWQTASGPVGFELTRVRREWRPASGRDLVDLGGMIRVREHPQYIGVSTFRPETRNGADGLVVTDYAKRRRRASSRQTGHGERTAQERQHEAARLKMVSVLFEDPLVTDTLGELLEHAATSVQPPQIADSLEAHWAIMQALGDRLKAADRFALFVPGWRRPETRSREASEKAPVTLGQLLVPADRGLFARADSGHPIADLLGDFDRVVAVRTFDRDLRDPRDVLSAHLEGPVTLQLESPRGRWDLQLGSDTLGFTPLLHWHAAGNDVGVLKLYNFEPGLAFGLKFGLDDLSRRLRPGWVSVLDLQDNPGGRALEVLAVETTLDPDAPLTRVTATRGQKPCDDAFNWLALRELEGWRDAVGRYDGPVVVAVNRRSASASEALANWVKHQGRGLLVGEPTFCKPFQVRRRRLPDRTLVYAADARIEQPRGTDYIFEQQVTPHVSIHQQDWQSAVRAFGERHQIDLRTTVTVLERLLIERAMRPMAM